MNVKLLNADCVEAMAAMEPESVDAIVCDPPYGLEFMGKEWDSFSKGGFAQGNGYAKRDTPAWPTYRWQNKRCQKCDHIASGGSRCQCAEPDWIMERPEHAAANHVAQAWHQQWAEQAFRVLKPGGYLLAFGGTRTFHRLACAIEDSGFEIRDSIAYMYGSGFPKSMDVSKAIDKAGGVSPVEQARVLRDARIRAGLTPEQVAEAVGCTPSSIHDWEEGRARATGTPREHITPSPEYRDKLADLLGYTADERKIVGVGGGRRSLYESGHRGIAYGDPTTEQAKSWQGWGTALKPAMEPIVVARKPLSGTVASNVLKYGTGALNIDGCRVATGDDLNGGTYSNSKTRPENERTMAGGAFYNGIGEYEQPAGRWPANVILSHTPECVQVGERTVKGDQRGDCGGTRPSGFANIGADAGSGEPNAAVYGNETVATYRCAEGCPVKELDEQSGISKSPPVGSTCLSSTSRDGTILGAATPAERPNGHGDEGGASRFFNTFEPDFGPPFYYCAKASTSEREAGLHERERQIVNDGMNTPIDNPYQRGDTKRLNVHPCLPPEELVLTAEGWREIAKVDMGDRVYSDDGRFHEVVDKFPTPVATEIVKIRAEATPSPTRATGNHPFLVMRPTKNLNAIVGTEVIWTRADEVQVGDYTLTPIARTGDKPVDPDWAWAVGLWVAEGSFQRAGHGSNKYPVYVLHAKETDFVDRLRKALPGANISVYPRENSMTVMVFDNAFALECERLSGHGARTKRLNLEVLEWAEPARRALLAGYLAGDGNVIRGNWRAKTSSDDLVPGLSLLAESVGYYVSAYRYEGGRETQIAGRTVVGGSYWQLYFAAPPVKQRRPRTIEHDGVSYTLRRVKSVEREAYQGDVWNLTVDGAHTFQTVAGMSHNTVKPVQLMRHLVKLVTPPGGTVLDPFLGSGTTGIACVFEGFNFVGIEKDTEHGYLEIAQARIDYAVKRVADGHNDLGKPKPVVNQVPEPSDDDAGSAPVTTQLGLF